MMRNKELAFLLWWSWAFFRLSDKWPPVHMLALLIRWECHQVLLLAGQRPCESSQDCLPSIGPSPALARWLKGLPHSRCWQSSLCPSRVDPCSALHSGKPVPPASCRTSNQSSRKSLWGLKETQLVTIPGHAKTKLQAGEVTVESLLAGPAALSHWDDKSQAASQIQPSYSSLCHFWHWGDNQKWLCWLEPNHHLRNTFVRGRH